MPNRDIVHQKFDYGLEKNKGIRYVYNVIRKTWSRYFRGLAIFGIYYKPQVLTLPSAGRRRYFRRVVTFGESLPSELYGKHCSWFKVFKRKWHRRGTSVVERNKVGIHHAPV